MDTLRAMELFVAVVESGSFAAAAERENISSPALSRQVAGLEEHLGARLLNRTTRRLSLTEAGRDYLARAQAILADVAEAEAEAGQARHAPKGLLRVSAPLSWGLARLAPILAGFRARYPELRLDIDLTDRMVDLVHEGIDVALRIAAQPAGTLIARRLADVAIIACAAPGYLARAGAPHAPEDLAGHATLLYNLLSMGSDITFTRGTEARLVRLGHVVEANNGDILRDLAIAGEGIILQPDFVVEQALADGRLVRVLPDWHAGDYGLFAVYSSRRHQPAKVRVFIDHLVASQVGGGSD